MKSSETASGMMYITLHSVILFLSTIFHQVNEPTRANPVMKFVEQRVDELEKVPTPLKKTGVKDTTGEIARQGKVRICFLA